MARTLSKLSANQTVIQKNVVNDATNDVSGNKVLRALT